MASNEQRPSSIEEALSRLDQALSAPVPTLNEIVTSDVDALKTKVATQVDDAKIRAHELSVSAREAASEAFVKGRESATQAAALIDTKVRENIWAVVGGVAAGTFALGFLLARNSGSES